MNLEKKLAQWRAAGVVDEATATRIADFEQQSHRPVLLYALGGLGALTLGLGILSIVAANWDAIPRTSKLGLDLVAGAAIAAGLFRAATHGEKWLTDVLAGVYYVFVLASIALVGQVYQLGSPQYQGLLTWSLATAPFMLLVRGPLLGATWLAGLLVTAGFTYAYFLDWLSDTWPDELVRNTAVSLTFATTVALLVVSRIPAFARERPLVSGVWSRMLWTGLVGTALLLCIVLYFDVDSDDDKLGWSIAVCGLLAGGLYGLLPRLYPEAPQRARTGMGLLLAATWLLLAMATAIERDAMPAVGAILQVGVLGLAAWTVLAFGSIRTFNSLTGLIALRVLVMYFEVFGSMLDTGLGMITGGLLTLGLAWVWKKKSPELADLFGGAAEGAGAFRDGGGHAS